MIIRHKNYKINARKILANNIVYFRKCRNWSQEEFADKLKASTTYVSNIENALRNVRIDYVGHIADTLDVSIEQLFVERNVITDHRISRR